MRSSHERRPLGRLTVRQFGPKVMCANERTIGPVLRQIGRSRSDHDETGEIRNREHLCSGQTSFDPQAGNSPANCPEHAGERTGNPHSRAPRQRSSCPRARSAPPRSLQGAWRRDHPRIHRAGPKTLGSSHSARPILPRPKRLPGAPTGPAHISLRLCVATQARSRGWLGQPAAVYTALASNCFKNFWRERFGRIK
jgi:hypothetical protein